MLQESARVGIHDSAKARDHWTQGMYFEKNAEAERIIEWFNARHPELTLTLRWGRQTGARMGACSVESGRIYLYIGGDSIATLLHEIAHRWEYTRHHTAGHGPNFHKAQDEILDIFDLNAHQMILGMAPTMRHHAAAVIARADARGTDLDSTARGYCMMNNIDLDTLETELLNLI